MYENDKPSQNSLYPQQGPYSTTGGWHYANGSWHLVQPASPPKADPAPAAPQNNSGGTGGEKPKKKTGRRFLAAVAMVLACAIFGFGGGYAAIALYGGQQQNEPTVIYRSPENEPAGTSGVSNAGGMSVSDIAEKAGSSVVSITTENMVNDYFFGNQVVSGAGSGVIISQDGFIITNNHVVEGANNITVTLPDGSEYPAEVVGTDKRTDVAVVKINATGLTPAVIGDSATLRVGEFCLAIGNPLGKLGGTVTDGIISALDRTVTIDDTTMNLLQMNAAVSPGNSGGGLFNSKGELIGIVNAKNASAESEGLGFAIPVNTAIGVAEDLISHGYVTGRPGLGVSVLTITSTAQAREYGISLDTPGLYITVVTAGGGADNAGIQPWDRIVSADGVEVNSSADLQNVLAGKSVGDTIEMVLDRGGQMVAATVTLGELKVAG